MREKRLHGVVRTPHNVVFEHDLSALRVPTETGQVGLRPGGEPTVLSVEPGLITARADGNPYYIGTAGGLLTFDGTEAVILTPLGVVGTTRNGVLAELEVVLAAPNVEMQARAAIDRLESGILKELARERTGGRSVPLKETK